MIPTIRRKDPSDRLTDPSRPENGEIPPGVIYLCQVNENVSCGACCGLYNIPDLSKDRLLQLLQERTAAFRTVPREIEAIIAFGEKILADLGEKPFPEFHHCPFVGLIGADLSRPGCLLHPLGIGNRGVDFRGLSEYGGMACRSFFCPTYRNLDAEEKRILTELFALDWYAYGLLITDHGLVTASFEAVREHLGRPFRAEMVKCGSAAAEALRKFLLLKFHWPFQRTDGANPVNYFFEDGLYDRKPLFSDSSSSPGPWKYERTLFELESAFPAADSLCRAQEMITAHLEEIEAALKKRCIL